MPLEIPEDMGVAKLKWRATGDSQEMISSIGFARVLGSTPNDIAAEISARWETAWPPASLSDRWAFAGCDVAVGPVGVAEVGIANRNVVGTAGWGSLPTNCSLLVTKITAQPGKGGRGRMFLPAGYLSEGELDQNGFASGGALAGWQANIGAFFTDAGSGTMDTVLAWMLFHNTAAANPGGSLPDQITSLIVEPQIATQRQRMRR